MAENKAIDNLFCSKPWVPPWAKDLERWCQVSKGSDKVSWTQEASRPVEVGRKVLEAGVGWGCPEKPILIPNHLQAEP